jgi:Putative Tad-like Flp pilus-assembly
MPYRKPWIKSQAGQAIVLIVFMMIALLAGVGLAVDAGVGYYYNTSAERAAAAAALAGVIFMPNQFGGSQANGPDTSIPAGAGSDASDRAVNEARRNGFDINDAAHNVQVLPAPVPGSSNKLQVTVSRTAPTFFMAMFGIPSFKVQRVAIATYLPPLTLGQPGNQIGSTVVQLGIPGSNNFYFQRYEGWSTPRAQGDPFTPNPAPAGSTDVHQISGVKGVDVADPSLPTRGGQNYLINIPAGGGSIQVYNAIYGPDDGSGARGRNICDNHRQGSPAAAIGPCNANSQYYYHEEDGANFSDPTTFNASEYTLFRVNSYFIRGSDTKLDQFKVLPINASNWAGATQQYTEMFDNNSTKITQTYDAAGNATNMLTYHNWIDVATYGGAADGSTLRWTAGFGPQVGGYKLPGGTYRLRVDSLANTGANGSADPPTGNNGQAHKGYSVRVMDNLGNACGNCSIGAWSDMTIYTPIDASSGSFQIYAFQIAPDYAGQTVTIDIYDSGDITSGTLDLYLVDPNNNVARPTAPATVAVYNLGSSRSTSPGTLVTAPLTDPTQAYAQPTTAGTKHFDGQWLHFEIPIPTTYSPGANPNNWWWKIRYLITPAGTATDTFAIGIGLKGNPAHLLVS